MLSRRQLLKVSGSAALAAAFRDDGEARVRAASEAVQRQPPTRSPPTRTTGGKSSRRSPSIAPSSISTTAAAARARASCTRPSSAISISRTRRRSTTCGRCSSRTSRAVRRRLAAEFGCDPEELAITRNASEALQIAQLGVDLRAGDEVVTTNQDYGRMLDTWEQRVRRDGIRLSKISFPVPPQSQDELADRLLAAITPATKVLHFCHITNLTGQIFPVRRICDEARRRGVTTIVDGAHAFAHFPYKAADLGCDYYGTSLHKWLLAPIGTGFLYVRREHIPALWPLTPAVAEKKADIRKFEEIGTHPAANHNAIAEAMAFHQGIGIERKAARLRYLRDRWATRLAAHPKVRIHTNLDPAHSCAIGTVQIAGVPTRQVVERLWAHWRIIATPIVHAEYEGVRVTPNVYTTLEEIDTFAGERWSRLPQKAGGVIPSPGSDQDRPSLESGRNRLQRGMKCGTRMRPD